MRTPREEKPIEYPLTWASEYRKTGFVALWRKQCPELFEDHAGSTRLGTLDLFPQYALMFLLQNGQGISSITWYNLADSSKRSKNEARTRKYWGTMRRWMGSESFQILQDRLRHGGFANLRGEPDLFCWNPENGKWFFAEAKRKDKLSESQEHWFQVCEQALGKLADIL